MGTTTATKDRKQYDKLFGKQNQGSEALVSTLKMFLDTFGISSSWVQDDESMRTLFQIAEVY